jgi:uncharacterized protein YlbG (UPF0298 family)
VVLFILNQCLNHFSFIKSIQLSTKKKIQTIYDDFQRDFEGIPHLQNNNNNNNIVIKNLNIINEIC